MYPRNTSLSPIVFILMVALAVVGPTASGQGWQPNDELARRQKALFTPEFPKAYDLTIAATADGKQISATRCIFTVRARREAVDDVGVSIALDVKELWNETPEGHRTTFSEREINAQFGASGFTLVGDGDPATHELLSYLNTVLGFRLKEVAGEGGEPRRLRFIPQSRICPAFTVIAKPVGTEKVQLLEVPAPTTVSTRRVSASGHAVIDAASGWPDKCEVQIVMSRGRALRLLLNQVD